MIEQIVILIEPVCSNIWTSVTNNRHQIGHQIVKYYGRVIDYRNTNIEPISFCYQLCVSIKWTSITNNVPQ